MSTTDIPTRLEQVVGARRHPTRHIVNARTTGAVIILHPEACRMPHVKCRFTQSLAEHGIPAAWWDKRQAWDRPVYVALRIDGPLWPCRDLPEETP